MDQCDSGRVAGDRVDASSRHLWPGGANLSAMPANTCPPPCRRPSQGDRKGNAQSALGLRRVLRATGALGHELVEFGLVLGVPQAVEELLELALLLFEAAQSFRAILVKSPVAARRGSPAPPSARVSLTARLPVARAASHPMCHSPAADQIAQNDEAERPPNQKTHHCQGDPGRVAEIVE